MKKYFSPSEMFLWCKDREQYYDQYILGKPFEPNDKMKAGKIIHSYLADNRYPVVKELKELGFTNKRIVVVRKMLNKIEPKLLPEREKSMGADFKGIRLFGIFDGFDKKNRILAEYKTMDESSRKWYNRDIDRNEQLSFYALIYKLSYFQYFKEIKLYRMNTERGTVQTIHTARGPKDLEYIAEKISKCVDEIKAENLWEKRLSRKERDALNQIKLEV